MKVKKGALEAERILDKLTSYTVTHCDYEEKLLESHGYPKTEEHKKIRRELIDKVANFRNDIKNDKAGLSMYLMHFLLDWLKGHILKSDKEHAPFLKKGVYRPQVNTGE